MSTTYKIVNGILQHDIYTEGGVLLLSKGTNMQESHMNLLARHAVKTEHITECEEEVNDVKYNDAVQHMKQLMGEVADGNVSNLEDAITPFHSLLEDMLQEHNLLHMSRALHTQDALTYEHSVNVGFLSALIGKILNVPDALIGKLGEMGLLHDIGKLKIQQEVGLEGSFELSEESEDKRHTQYGYELLKGSPGIHYLVPVAALLHHEACDGSGYPHGYTEEKIPFPVQIVTVADKYDRLCSSEVAGGKVSPLDAAERIKRDSFDGKLNPKIVLPFVNYLKQHFVHQTVTLSDGQVGEIIYFSNDELTKPLVRVGDTFIDLKKETNLRIIG
ncbi:HD-GYP domain-containing protein [Priestia taiwanensis]|uniref:HD family phosphohydrolase n=1 Tax=Priestia taiwanensis TaxID=1347902 RepID=A0A917AQ06_9BACI|nr:HD domain-containing phosphohydrolase [Priestia taiwanensis]MBM7362901.1 HD-GYP domain-containing protein (c-di-GMP phosphodiesterase class II) [Priestia taiwanensis]GGE66046.1 HD family phosphohydrolase [Priestia taiwanensis]